MTAVARRSFKLRFTRPASSGRTLGQKPLYKGPCGLVRKRSVAQMAELVDALVSGTSDASRGGSSPLLGTKFLVIVWLGFLLIVNVSVTPRRAARALIQKMIDDRAHELWLGTHADFPKN